MGEASSTQYFVRPSSERLMLKQVLQGATGALRADARLDKVI